MGLDMYLYAEKYIPSYSYENDNDGVTRRDNLEYDKVLEASNLIGLPSTDYGSVKVTKQVGYWRKANAIHGWIVRNLAGGVDECQEIPLDKDDLIKLRDVCLKELTNRSEATPNSDSTINLSMDTHSPEELMDLITKAMQGEANKDKTLVADPMELTPVDGFFFGGTDKDEYYYHSIEYTIDMINSLLTNDKDLRYYYRASW